MKHPHTFSPLPLEGRTALVTGGGRRIGAAIVRALAEAGATVWVHCNRSRPDAKALLATLGPRAGGVLSADLASPDARAAFYDEARRRSGGIDIWINNAAVFFPDTAPDDAIAVQRTVNHDAPLYFLDALASDRRSACVIHILDARIALPPDTDTPFPAYTATKRDLAATIVPTATALAPLGIRVNAIAPGDVLPPETHRERARPVPLPHRPTPGDIARAAVFLAASPALTAQTLYIDSGLHLPQACASACTPSPVLL